VRAAGALAGVALERALMADRIGGACAASIGKIGRELRAAGILPPICT
jgi:hypothetical protein